jgi:pimeloyl-ACP methyl ester carboxylesterase
MSAEEIGTVSVNGVSLEYIDWGGEAQPIILIPPGCDTAHVYGDIGPLLARRFKTFSFTQRGCGRSDHPDAGYEIDELVDEIGGFMTAVGVERATLAGASSAGGKITRFSELNPERVDKLIYFDTVYRHITPAIEEGIGAAIADVVGGLPNESFEMMRATEELWELGAWSQAREKNLREVYTVNADGSLRGTASQAWFDAWRRDNADGRYAGTTKIDHPALMLFAKGLDRYRIQQFDDQTQERLRPIVEDMIRARDLQIADFRKNGPHVRIVEFDRTAHYVYVHRPQAVVDLIVEFLKP